MGTKTVKMHMFIFNMCMSLNPDWNRVLLVLTPRSELCANPRHPPTQLDAVLRTMWSDCRIRMQVI